MYVYGYASVYIHHGPHPLHSPVHSSLSCFDSSNSRHCASVPHTPSARNPKAMLRAPEIRDALVYQSFRGGSNAPSFRARCKVGIIRVAGRMRLTNYCECEATRVYVRSYSFVALITFFVCTGAMSRGRLTRGANSRRFVINWETR